MLIDKEYPATHSMSTSWYAVDEDGNVALVHYSDNGPVPQGLVPDLFLDDLVLNIPSSDIDGIHTGMFTKKQANEFLGEEISISDWSWFEKLVFVKPEYLDKFIKHIKEQPNAKEFLRLSKDSNVFYIDGDECESLMNKLAKEGYFDKILLCDFWINGEYDDQNNLIWEKEFKSVPFFVYGEPYWPSHPVQRVHIPVNPVKIEQLPEAIRNKIIRLPLKFKNANQFQIAEFVPCYVETDMADSRRVTYKNQTYYLMVNAENGHDYYAYGNIIDNMPSKLSVEEVESLIKKGEAIVG